MTRPDSPDPAALAELGEYVAAGWTELPECGPMRRFARACRRWFEAGPLPEYDGGPLYPSAAMPASGLVMAPSYSFTLTWHESIYVDKLQTATPTQAAALKSVREQFLGAQHDAQSIREATVHTVGGAGYTHSIVHFGRVLREGLNSYAERIAAGRAAAGDDGRRCDFYAGLADLLVGIACWQRRLQTTVEHAGSADSKRLHTALARVPFAPARSFYEAMVAYNVLYYIDGCDNPGRFDQELMPWLTADPEIGHAGAVKLVSAFFDNVAANSGWSIAIGGTRADGGPAYQEMTRVVLEACGKRHRPSIELRVRPDMPDDLWELALTTQARGTGQPALYNEPGYLKALRAAELGLSDADLAQWNGGGCTETMIHGCSNVGSLDAGLNLPLILCDTLHRELALVDVSFESLLTAYKTDVAAAITDIATHLNRMFAARAAGWPQPVRSLLVDDCIERGLDFNAGGARYNWSVINIAGLANVADSLAAVREVVFAERRLSATALGQVLANDFADCEPLRQRLLRCPKFGNDDDDVDRLAADIASFVYGQLLSHRCHRGGRFLPSHIMFETYAGAGRAVGATPDGRHAGTPLADSAGPMQGRDRHGPTAMLRSVARLPQQMAAGTPVLNMRLTPALYRDPGARQRLRALVEAYFAMGGLQLQMSVVDREVLLAAISEPERHQDLIVRIGGYATYFNWLSDDLKREFISRTEYDLV